jgi:predicted kinase
VDTSNQYEPSTHSAAISNGSRVRQWSTFDAYFNQRNGTWLTERLETVHKPIIDTLFAGKLPSKARQPRCALLGGGLGVGKSTLAREIQTARPNSILIDPDVFKQFIPEYAWLQLEDLDTALLRVHDESRHIAQEALARAVTGRYDVILDTCASGSETHGLVTEFKSRGYNLAMQFVDTPVEVAIARIKVAASVPGRAHYGRWAFAPENKQWQSPENPFAPPADWKWVTDLFAGRTEFDAWRRLLARS